MPAGEYFNKRFSTSREYIFWMSFLIDFSDSDLERIFGKGMIDYKKTSNDAYKLHVTYEFINLFLYEKTKKELEIVENKYVQMSNLDTEPIKAYKRYFGIDNEIFQIKLIESVRATILYSQINEDERKNFIQNYLELLNKFNNLFS